MTGYPYSNISHKWIKSWSERLCFWVVVHRNYLLKFSAHKPSSDYVCLFVHFIKYTVYTLKFNIIIQSPRILCVNGFIQLIVIYSYTYKPINHCNFIPSYSLIIV